MSSIIPLMASNIRAVNYVDLAGRHRPTGRQIQRDHPHLAGRQLDLEAIPIRNTEAGQAINLLDQQDVARMGVG